LGNTYLPDDALVYIIDDGSEDDENWLVRFKCSLAGHNYRHSKGQQVLYSRERAEGMIKSGVCELVERRGSPGGGEIRKIIKGFKPSCQVKTLFKKKNLGMYDSLLTGHDWAFGNGYDFVVTLADDIVVNNYFYAYMDYYRRIFPDNIISGFNTLSESNLGEPRHPVIHDGGWYVKKKTSGSACMGIDRDLYRLYFRPALEERVLNGGGWYDTLATGRAYIDNRGVVCTVPSVAEHIGMESTMGHTDNPDVACDFVMKYDPIGDRGKAVTVNIATYPPRKRALRTLIKHLVDYDIIDTIRVYLNEYDKVPDFLLHPKVETHMGENLKDSGKFYWAEGRGDEYYFTLDDDLLPGEQYFADHIRLLEKYDGMAFVSSHGKVLRPHPADFRDFSELYRCTDGFEGDHWVNFPGTGVMVFDNSKFCFPMFDTHGMSDLHIARYLQRNRIPCVVRGHDKDELKMLYSGKDTLWRRRNEMRAEHADILNSIKKWMLLAIIG